APRAHMISEARELIEAIRSTGVGTSTDCPLPSTMVIISAFASSHAPRKLKSIRAMKRPVKTLPVTYFNSTKVILNIMDRRTSPLDLHRKIHREALYPLSLDRYPRRDPDGAI